MLDNPAITKDNADVVVTWASGHHDVITGFDPETDTIFIDWIDATALDIANVNGSAVFSIPSNSQSTTLQGVSLADLQARNIHVQDSTARAELAGLIGSDTPDGGGGGEPGGTSGGGPGETGGTDSGTTTDGTGEPGGADGGTSGSETGKSGLAAEDVNNPGITAANADVVITWSYGQAVTRTDFDPATDTIFIDWIGAADLEVTEAGGTTTFSVPSNQHSVTLSGVALADLVAANIHAQDATARAELARLLSAGSDAGTPAGGTDSTGTVGVDTDVVEVTWNWAAVITIDGFDPAGDVLDFNGLAASDLLVVETGAGLIFEVLNNGGHSVTLTGIQAEDLGFDNLTADSWNTVLSETSGLMQQLQSLGFDPA
ncbi:MAG: hypothetical protein KDA50_10570 [Rhodobacteraceae bacterium]|nr:hypothetical protein [Paracoccaceae bacterium]